MLLALEIPEDGLFFLKNIHFLRDCIYVGKCEWPLLYLLLD